jgi:hypothetical protein
MPRSSTGSSIIIDTSNADIVSRRTATRNICAEVTAEVKLVAGCGANAYFLIIDE